MVDQYVVDELLRRMDSGCAPDGPCDADLDQGVHLRVRRLPEGVAAGAVRRNGELWVLLDPDKPLGSEHAKAMVWERLEHENAEISLLRVPHLDGESLTGA